MALLAKVELNTGEEKELYLRINNVSSSNHGADASALVRGFISKSAYENGKHFAHEESIEFPVDVSIPMWEQGYSKLKELYPDGVDC